MRIGKDWVRATGKGSQIQQPLTSSRQAVKLCRFQSSCYLFHRMVSEVSVNSNGSMILQVYKRKLKNNFLNSLVFLLGIFFLTILQTMFKKKKSYTCISKQKSAYCPENIPLDKKKKKKGIAKYYMGTVIFQS